MCFAPIIKVLTFYYGRYETRVGSHTIRQYLVIILGKSRKQARSQLRIFHSQTRWQALCKKHHCGIMKQFACMLLTVLVTLSFCLIVQLTRLSLFDCSLLKALLDGEQEESWCYAGIMGKKRGFQPILLVRTPSP